MKCPRTSCLNPHQILANGLCLLCCYKWDSDPEAAFPDDGADDGEDEGIVVSSASSGRSDEPIIALRNVEPLQVRTLKCLHISYKLREFCPADLREQGSGIHTLS